MPVSESAARGEVVVACADLDAALHFYTERLGFRLDMIMPADAPECALISGFGLSLRLERAGHAMAETSNDAGQTFDAHAGMVPTIRLRLPRSACPAEEMSKDRMIVPGNVAIEWIDAHQPTLEMPAVANPLIQRADATDGWSAGRAGMRYRDLIPGRVGGAVIASQIRIEQGGPVDDYVHFHKVGLQLIYCRRGWVRVVYEDQGPAFVMEPGDCVLQPPTIRHRVLESSDGLEVIELGLPAEHETWRDHELELPTPTIDRQRDFGGQRFVRQIVAAAEWQSLGEGGALCRDIGVDDATDGMASARVLRFAGDADARTRTPHPIYGGDLEFLFVLGGAIEIRAPELETIELGPGDACVLASHRTFALTAQGEAELLQVSAPGIRSTARGSCPNE